MHESQKQKSPKIKATYIRPPPIKHVINKLTLFNLRLISLNNCLYRQNL